MARTDVSAIQYVRNTGLDITFDAAHTDDNMFTNDGKAILLVNNGSGSPINVTLQTPALSDGDLAVADRVVAVPAGTITAIGYLSRSIYNQASGADAGKVYVDWSAIASVSFAVVHP